MIRKYHEFFIKPTIHLGTYVCLSFIVMYDICQILVPSDYYYLPGISLNPLTFFNKSYFLQNYHHKTVAEDVIFESQRDSRFLKQIITAEETWVPKFSMKLKQQSFQEPLRK